MKLAVIDVMGSNQLSTMDVENGIIYVALRPLVQAMGLDWNTQRKKVIKDTRYGHKPIPFKTQGGVQKMLSLATDHLPAFLYSINPNKVRKDLREKIIAFQSETFAVINAYWRDKQKSLPPKTDTTYKEKVGTLEIQLQESKRELTELKRLYNRAEYNHTQEINRKEYTLPPVMVEFLEENKEMVKRVQRVESLLHEMMQRQESYAYIPEKTKQLLQTEAHFISQHPELDQKAFKTWLHTQPKSRIAKLTKAADGDEAYFLELAHILYTA